MPVEDPVFSGDQVRHDKQKLTAFFLIVDTLTTSMLLAEAA
jgi:hypothetical protein